MQEKEFWELIGKLDWDETGLDDAVIEPVVEALSRKDVAEIYAFEEILAQKLHALDTRAHAREIGDEAYINDDEYFSEDGFLYSRCVIVANGEELFNHVLQNPAAFPKDMEFEAILGIAEAAYERKTGELWDYVPTTDYETYANETGWA